MTLDSGFLTLMFMVVLLDLFDKAYDRYGVKLGPWESVPDRAIVFGRMTSDRHWRPDRRFLFVKIPFVRTWGYIHGKHPMMPDAFGWRSHKLIWIESNNEPGGWQQPGGWQISPPLEG